MTTEQTASRPLPGDPNRAITPPCLDIFDGLDTHALVDRFRAGVGRLDPRVLDLADGDLDRPWAPEAGVGEWSCRSLLTHLMDTELLFTMRIRRTIAEDCPVFEPWDEDAFERSRLSRPGPEALLMPAGALVAASHTLRQTLATVLVQLTGGDWERRALHPHRGEMTLRGLVAYACWHFEHHAVYLNAKLDALLGPVSGAEASGQGCGAGCSCVGGDRAAS